jgi:hypothetical protein
VNIRRLIASALNTTVCIGCALALVGVVVRIEVIGLEGSGRLTERVPAGGDRGAGEGIDLPGVGKLRGWRRAGQGW